MYRKHNLLSEPNRDDCQTPNMRITTAETQIMAFGQTDQVWFWCGNIGHCLFRTAIPLDLTNPVSQMCAQLWSFRLLYC